MKLFRNWTIKKEGSWMRWSVEWYDGKGGYIGSDCIPWWRVPYDLWWICKEKRV